MRFAFSERYVVALNFLLIAGIAYFAALSVNDLVARRMFVVPPAPHAETAPPPPAPLTRDAYDLIVQRDVFNAVRQAPAAAPPPPTAADLHLKLVGTSHLSWTKPFAILEDDNTHDQATYQLGDQIPDAGQLTAVDSDKVVIDHGGTPITLQIPQEAQGDAPAAPSPAPIMNMMPPMFGRDVHRIGPNEFLMHRSALERNLQNMGQLFTQMRAIPNVENGKTDGFRLSEVVPGSLFAQMGLRNGDLVTNIGGQVLNDPTQAITLLNSLRDSNSLQITVNRGGRPTELNYDIR